MGYIKLAHKVVHNDDMVILNGGFVLITVCSIQYLRVWGDRVRMVFNHLHTNLTFFARQAFADDLYTLYILYV